MNLTIEEFLRRVIDFGRLSGGQMKKKYGADPMQGYDWIASQAKALQTQLAHEGRVTS